MTEVIIIVLVVLALLVLLMALMLRTKRRPKALLVLPDAYIGLLKTHVPFYNQLGPGQQRIFESRLQNFLSHTRITGVKTEVSDLDRVLVAASAIIPIFRFDNWEYPNLNEVLLYPESFNHEFEQEGSDRSILGMVGTGPLQNVMVLSQHELRQGFTNLTGKTNTAIHEFVHLVDKTDGFTDGVPENIISQPYIKPWVKMMHRKITEIREGRSDINPYGATDEGEFFAVVSEYFFERPELLQQKHPELFQLLSEIFQARK